MKIIQDGKEIEVHTSEEVAEREAAAATKAVEEFKIANPDKTAEIEGLKNKLAESEELLRKAEEDGGNKGQIDRLRKERDDAKKASDDAQKNFDKKVDEKIQEAMSGIVGDIKKELLDVLSGADAEMRKKIELEFDKYRPGENSKQAIKERMDVAFQIVAGRKPAPGILDGKTSGGDRGAGGGYNPPPKSGEVTPNQKAIGNVLGITDKDRENFNRFEEDRKQKKAIGLIPPNAI